MLQFRLPSWPLSSWRPHLARAAGTSIAWLGLLSGPIQACQHPRQVLATSDAPAKDLAAPATDEHALLREFLAAIDDDTLQELAAQTSSERHESERKLDREQQTAAVLRHMQKSGATPLVLKPRSPRSLNVALEPGATYVMAPPERAWKTSVVDDDGKRRMRVTRDVHTPVMMTLTTEAMRRGYSGELQRICGSRFNFEVAYTYEFTEDTFTIPANTVIVTPASTVSFPHGLVMGEGAKLVGTHPCGLTVKALYMSGAGAACDASRITTSALPTSEIDPDCLEQYTPLRSELFRVRNACRDSILNIDGSIGTRGESFGLEYVPFGGSARPKVGANGAAGKCDWIVGICASFTAPGNGQSVSAGEDGGDGVNGGHGRSTADLRIITDDLRGFFCLSTEAGNGGNGGAGGSGQSVFGGNGGDLSRWCSSCDSGAAQPGKGGSVDRAGDGGDGGDAGHGGDAGDIYLVLPDTGWSSETLARTPIADNVLAIVRAGEAGRASPGGVPGIAIPGVGGRWINPWDDGTEPSGRDGSGPSREAVPGTQGRGGRRGVNGRVYLNGALSRGTEDQRASASWQDFTWPWRAYGKCAAD